MNNYLLIDIDRENLEVLRTIRNDCRKYMTRNSNYINSTQQSEWFSLLEKTTIPFIFNMNNKNIGYGVIKIDGPDALLTGGLSKKYRGAGHGKMLFSMLIEKAYEQNLNPKLEVLKSNAHAFKLYKSLGFEVIYENDDVFTMTIKKNI